MKQSLTIAMMISLCFALLCKMTVGHALSPIQEDALNVNSQIREPQSEAALKASVTKALEQAQKGEFSATVKIAKDRDKARRSLRYLSPYTSNPDYHLATAICILASSAKTPHAVQIVADILPSAREEDSVHNVVIASVFSEFSPELVRNSGAKVKVNLLTLLKRSPTYAEVNLVLSSFKGDREVIAVLEKNKKLWGSKMTQINAMGESKPVPLSFCIELALSEAGEQKSLRKIRNVLSKKGRPEEILFCLHAINYINNKDSLARIVELLKDKRVAREGRIEDGPLVRLTVAEQVFLALRYKAGQEKYLDLLEWWNIPDKELKTAYLKYRRMIKQGRLSQSRVGFR